MNFIIGSPMARGVVFMLYMVSSAYAFHPSVVPHTLSCQARYASGISPLGSLHLVAGRPGLSARGLGRSVHTKGGNMQMTASPVTGEDSGSSTATGSRNVMELLAKVGRLAQPFWNGENKQTAIIWTIGTIFLALFNTVYVVAISFIQKFFWNALNAKDLAKFNKFLLLYLGVLTVGPPLLVLFDWAKSRMALSWRDALTKRYLGKYVNEKSYYKLELDGTVDNSDQRIAEDIKAFCDKAVSLFCTVTIALLDLIVFSVILYKIYPPLYFTLIAYATIGTTVTIFFGMPLIKINRLQLKKEADFRFSLVRVRENAESIAFYSGERREREESSIRFRSLFQNAVSLLNFERNLSFFTRYYKYLVQVVPAIVIGPQYFAGKVPLGAISQTFFSFNHVLTDLSIVVSEFTGPNGISSFSAQVERLDQLSKAVDRIEKLEGRTSDKIDQTQTRTDGSMELKSVSVLTPTGEGPVVEEVFERENLISKSCDMLADPSRTLVEALDLHIAAGSKTLVVGRSGIGKSSLMRAIAGLWDNGGGSISCPKIEHTIFLSQKPYLTLGSLRENVVYPTPVAESTMTDEEVLAILEKVQLENIASRVGLDDADKQLSTILSLGEQQRLAFARVLAAKPKMVILDESTSALDLENEEAMYKNLQEMDVTVLSVGNRPSLVQFHDTVLRLTGDGAWKVEEAKK